MDQLRIIGTTYTSLKTPKRWWFGGISESYWADFKRECQILKKCVWSLESGGAYLVKSLVNHLKFLPPLGKGLEKALWKTKGPCRVNITIWSMIFGALNCSEILQAKLPKHTLSPLICHLCLSAVETQQHLFFECNYAVNCWQKNFRIYSTDWVFSNSFQDNIVQLLTKPSLKSGPKLMWINAVKALFLEIWFERNQQIFQEKSTSWQDRFELAKLNASSWCSISKFSEDYSV